MHDVVPTSRCSRAEHAPLPIWFRAGRQLNICSALATSRMTPSPPRVSVDDLPSEGIHRLDGPAFWHVVRSRIDADSHEALRVELLDPVAEVVRPGSFVYTATHCRLSAERWFVAGERPAREPFELDCLGTRESVRDRASMDDLLRALCGLGNLWALPATPGSDVDGKIVLRGGAIEISAHGHRLAIGRPASIPPIAPLPTAWIPDRRECWGSVRLEIERLADQVCLRHGPLVSFLSVPMTDTDIERQPRGEAMTEVQRNLVRDIVYNIPHHLPNAILDIKLSPDCLERTASRDISQSLGAYLRFHPALASLHVIELPWAARYLQPSHLVHVARDEFKRVRDRAGEILVLIAQHAQTQQSQAALTPRGHLEGDAGPLR